MQENNDFDPLSMIWCDGFGNVLLPKKAVKAQIKLDNFIKKRNNKINEQRKAIEEYYEGNNKLENIKNVKKYLFRR